MAKGRRLPSVMKNRFSTVPTANIRRSSFDRSHGYKTTMNVDYLVPIFVDEVLPGDTFSLTSTHLCRLTTLVQPIMDNLRLDLQFFYVPNRLLWKGQRDQTGNETGGWEEFITGGDQPVAWTGDNPAEKLFLPQTIVPDTIDGKIGYSEGSIYDYMGLPIGVANYKHTVLPLRAYNLIWNEYYRDQNLQESVPVWTGDADPKVDENGEESTDPSAKPYIYRLLKRNKRYDYFTSALPGLQKGPSVSLSLLADSGRLPVQGLAIAGINPNETLVNTTPSASALEGYLGIGQSPKPISPAGSNYYNTLYDANGIIKASDNLYRPQSNWGNSNDPFLVVKGDKKITFTYPYNSQTITETAVPIAGPDFPIYVDLSNATSVTVNSLRTAIVLQRWYELNARAGSRYIESILAHFSVHAQDYRLQRPEYLGGSKSYISINPTVQSSSTDSTSPQGNLAAYALSTDTKRLFTKSFVEHGWIIGLASVTADLTYQSQGLDRMWSRFSRFDFCFPSLAHLSEQPVYNREIYCQSDSVIGTGGVPQNDLPFGYQERYAEYRYKNSKITGLFRTNASGTLDSWHLAQYFENLPTLNKTFIESTTPIDRALAVPSQPDLLCDFFSTKI